MNDNNMRGFLAYGTSIVTDLDLSDRLLTASSCPDALKIVSRTHPQRSRSLELATPVMQGHGRELSIFTDREFGPGFAGQSWAFEVSRVVRFDWIGGDALIHYELLEDGNEELLTFWLIHIFLPLWFTLEGSYEFIHACAVEVGGSSVMFMAPSMGGKSTLTDYFLKRGHHLVSDDKVAIVKEQGRFLAVPSHPNHRPYRRFEDLGVPVSGFSGTALPIAACFYLRRALRCR